MPDVTRLIQDDHEDLRRRFADLDDAQASGDLAAVTAVWQPLAALLELHAASEETVFYPALLGRGDNAEDEAEDAIEDHNKIRDAVRAAAGEDPGTGAWWDAVGRARTENGDHIAEEEQEALPDFRLNADVGVRDELGLRWLRFRAEHPNGEGLDARDKDADEYIREHTAG